MNISDYVLIYIGSLFSSYVLVEGYNLVSERKKFRLSRKNIFLLILMSIILLFNVFFNKYLNKAIVTLVVYFLFVKIIFKEKNKYAIIKTLICYAFVAIYELLLSIFISLKMSLEEFSSQFIYQFLFSFIIMLLCLLTYNWGYLKKIASKINKLAYQNALNIFAVLSFNIAVIYMVTKYSIDFTNKTYFVNIILLIIFLILISIVIYDNIKSQKEIEKTETLLEFISKYEKMIDDDRVNRHEMLNNLLILKSFKKKRSVEFDKTLDDFIASYDKKGRYTIKNIYKLPSGLKGILYYKIKDINCDNLKTLINISKEVSAPLEKLNHKEYVSLCKLLGIVLDNSFEAAQDSNEKEVIINIYKENNYVIMDIENTFKNKVELDKINNKHYSTKGKGRGLGLFIADMIIRKNENIKMSQRVIDNRFLSQIKIKVDNMN